MKSSPDILPSGEVSLASLQIGGRSPCPPPGAYAAIRIESGSRQVRAFLSREHVGVLARWLANYTLKDPPAGSTSPMSVSAIATDWCVPATLTAPEPSRTHRRRSTATIAATSEGLQIAGDRLVFEEEIMALRERHHATSTAGLERELATYEPELAKAARRLVCASVAGELDRKEVDPDRVADACWREMIILLLGYRDAYLRLWADVPVGPNFHRGPGDGERP